MKTLRAKLFLSVGAILLIVAVLNYWFSQYWIKKELSKAAVALNQHIGKIQETIREFSSFLMTYKIVHGAAELDGVSKVVVSQGKSQAESSPWVFASRIATYNPQIAFVQVGNPSEGFAVVAPESASRISPKWATFEQGMLWIVFPENPTVYVAIPTVDNEKPLYYLFDEDNLKSFSTQNTPLVAFDDSLKGKLIFAAEHLDQAQTLNFVPFETLSNDYSWRDPAKKLFNAMLTGENEWVEKMDLIQGLALWQDKKGLVPAGLMIMDNSSHRVTCVLARDVFSTSPVTEDFSSKGNTELPTLILRKLKEESDLDMVKVFPTSNSQPEWIALGFSLSSLTREIAELSEKTIIVTWDQSPLGFTPKGEEFDPEKLGFPLKELKSDLLTWQGQQYVPLQVDMRLLQLTILTPESQARAATWFLEHLGDEIRIKITLSLIGASLLSFGIALLLLNRISRKITGPITMLSRASEELGKGKYEGLILPQLKKRHDEIEVLTHSFEGMVVALRDRDKIRGVLNKVVSKEITEEILKHSIELGGEERTITLLFNDIRGFTRFSEHLKPKELIGLLNDYMTRMCRIIDETQGVVDKFVGDEIMALYGAPLALIGHPSKAIEAAILMIRELKNWNEERQRRQEPIFEIGIGVHTGLVCTGNMGAENRLNYTAIGANVNLASRLCSAAGPMQILISEETYNFPGVKEKFRCKALPPATLKGIDRPVPIYEVLGD